MTQILMIEDDPAIVRLMEIQLADLPGFLTATASGLDGLEKLTHQSFDLCILDVMLPDMDGITVCQRIRLVDPKTPILMLTAKSEENDKVAGLEAGADDYLTKPFGQQELLARIRALLRRSNQVGSEKSVSGPPVMFAYKSLRIDVDKRIVTIHGNRIELTPKEFDLLVLLIRNPGKSFSRKELLSTVWGYSYEGYEHTVTAHVNRLRSKIEPNFNHPEYILTAWGVGYRFAETDSQLHHDSQN